MTVNKLCFVQLAVIKKVINIHCIENGVDVFVSHALLSRQPNIIATEAVALLFLPMGGNQCSQLQCTERVQSIAVKQINRQLKRNGEKIFVSFCGRQMQICYMSSTGAPDAAVRLKASYVPIGANIYFNVKLRSNLLFCTEVFTMKC